MSPLLPLALLPLALVQPQPLEPRRTSDKTPLHPRLNHTRCKMPSVSP